MTSFSKSQAKAIADLFFDFSKILFGSIVVGFFVPTVAGEISAGIFLGGLLMIALSVVAGLLLLRRVNGQ